ncbi:MHS family MFS transporter [Amycolatopsis acidicola]|uniref:MHS family MFS transporter n=1 Tax=Amycolatopsis acidicola TaxID=2596893 RepID=A0A5N0V8A9_9PSEU|nr:MFS transporter [Amycolatopsis acidicola]KAA9162636.1 MHS family MFS transporter [Amycolatopsis acidicola]
MRKKILGAAMFGHAVESYDFVIYGSSATIIARHFFPAGNQTMAILSTLAVYGIAFVVRPLGAAVFGGIGDRLGRRTALSTVVLIMAVSTVAIALLPGYAQVGALAPVLLICCRLAQGISMGAEYTSAASYVMEQAPAGKRGLWISTVGSATFIGSALATFALLVLKLASPAAYAEWTWRLAFLFGGLMALVGLYMRLRLEETSTFRALEARGETSAAPVRESFRDWRVFFLLFAVFALLAVVVHNLLGYLPTYLMTTGGVGGTTVLVAGGVALLPCTALSVVTGALADRFGRKPLLITGVAFAVGGSVPAYVLARGGTLVSTVAAEVLLAIPAAVVAMAATITAVELVSPRVRATSTALAYNIAYAVFGGTAPIVGALLTERFGKLAPGVYITVVAAIALLIVVVGMPETRERAKSPEAHGTQRVRR